MPFLKLFDAASVTECYQRKQSILPQQALALSNSALTRDLARLLARSLADKASEPAAFTTAAFEQVLSRAPTGPELEECLAFLEHRARWSGHDKTAAALRAREELVHVLLNHNDFVSIR